MVRIVTAALIAAATAFATSLNAVAQEPDLQALELANEIMALNGTQDAMNEILPNVADAAKTTLIRTNPQMQLGIIEIVDRNALELVERRRDLDARITRLWTQAFTKEELQEIVAFYKTPTGRKFADRQPLIAPAQVRIAGEWSNEISEELARRVQEELRLMAAAERKRLEAGPSKPKQ